MQLVYIKWTHIYMPEKQGLFGIYTTYFSVLVQSSHIQMSGQGQHLSENQMHSPGMRLKNYTTIFSNIQSIKTISHITVINNNMTVINQYRYPWESYAGINFIHNHPPPAPPRICTKNLLPPWGFCIQAFAQGAGICLGSFRGAGICL